MVLNSTVPESMLKKKHAAINYHRAREAIAAGVIRVAKEDTATNIADLLTKCLPGPALREHSNRILWRRALTAHTPYVRRAEILKRMSQASVGEDGARRIEA